MSTTNPLRTFFARRSDSAQDNSITTNLPVGFLDCVRLNALLVGMLLDWGVLVYDVAEDNLWRERVARKKMRENKEKKKEGGGDEDYFAATMAAEEAGEAANLNPTPPPLHSSNPQLSPRATRTPSSAVQFPPKSSTPPQPT